MLIDASYFIGELDIPNTDSLPVQENLQIFINKYEVKFLKMLLGNVLYAEYIAGSTLVPVEPATDPVTYEPIPQKWIDLQNQLRDVTTKVSPIANFIYFYFVRDKTIYNSGTGTQQAEGENSTKADSKIKTVRAWNEMNELCFEIHKFLKTNISVYGPLAYNLYFRDNWYLWDWSYWWGQLLPYYLRCIPEIYVPINTLNL